MNPCKKNCTCDRCKPCLPSKIKAIDPCQVQPVPSPAYGNFFRETSVTLNANQPMPWNGIGRTAGITLNPDTVTIEVAQAGDYYIDYYALVELDSTTNINALMGVFVNGNEVNPIQTRYGIQDLETDRNLCAPVSGGTIIFIPAGGTVQLRNVQLSSFRTCDGPALAASINLIKVS
ncbi:hypothetical protein P4562_22640 [Lysinibacillus xylanilyticus]|uniref:hypothetical protein n=1 Tax=Lysinibacillus xylanilyticus TaxID=582475 RepID=UPI002E1FAA28|nr:hypothetical protein [Lysinibacillus xylanilyticus]